MTRPWLSCSTLWLFAVWLIPGFGVTLLSAEPAAESQMSELWGQSGERWEPGSRLPDFSYAGYHRGERALPEKPAEVGVKDYGAVGDGETNDTRAFQRALEEAAGKVIAIPAGRYVITEILEIRDSGTVLRGEGPGKTILYVPKPLERIRSNMGATTSGRPTSNYSWSGGIVWVQGRFHDEVRARVTAPAERGEHTLTVDEVSEFQVGDEVRLHQRDDDEQTLIHHLYAGDPGHYGNLRNVRTNWFARIKAVDAEAQRITFDRPLRTDVRPAWEPRIHPGSSGVEEVGVEHLSFEFPVTDYEGHFTELGYNAIAMRDARHCWVRNIVIRHADSGMFIRGANHTLTGIRWESDRKPHHPRQSTGHHGITLGGTDLLLTDFDFHTRFIHDITMTRDSAGVVVRDGRGVDLAFDHHKYANHANLFTNIDAGVGANIFHSGGGSQLGRHCGAWTTWWNIRTVRSISFPAGWAPDRIQLVGVHSNKPAVTDPDGRWFEPIPPDQLVPQDLYEVQFDRRMRRGRP